MNILKVDKSKLETHSHYEGQITNVEEDEEGFVTLYTFGGEWYIILTKEDYSKVTQPTRV